MAKYYKNAANCFETAIEKNSIFDFPQIFQQRSNEKVTKTNYSNRFFGESFCKASAPMLAVAGFIIIDPLILFFCLTFASFGIVAGTIAGVSVVATRRPLDSDEINTVFGILGEITQYASYDVKNKILTEIVSRYKNNRFTSSETSYGLYKQLANASISLETKWNMVLKYMMQSMDQYHHHLLKNNAKKLFGVIAQVLCECKKTTTC